MIIGIVAISKNYAIGKDGKLPWHYSADLKFFKETTTGNAVVMGSTTWRSIGKPLPNRLNIVMSRSTDIELPIGVIKMSSVGEVLEFAKYFDGDVYIIGGASIYEAFAEVIKKWLVTKVPEIIDDADTFLSDDFLDAYELERTTELADDLTVQELRLK